MYGKIKPLVARVNWPAVGICTGHFERFKVDQIHSNVIFYLYFYSSNMVTLNHFTQCFFFLENCSHWRIKNKMHIYVYRSFPSLYLFIFSFYILLSYCKQIDLFLFTLKEVIMLNTSKEPVGHSQTTQVFVKN